MEPILGLDVRHHLSRIELQVELAVGRETLALVGPSGAGKTSVLRAVAGLLRPNAGRISFSGGSWFDAERSVWVPADRRRVGMVFQEGALFPHLTVTRNVAYGLRPKSGRSRGGDGVGDVLERFGLAELAHARPGSLSGGERQRVALARAVASDPVMLLLDEPLSALDPATKARVGAELWTHLRALALPAIIVSHDFADVVGLADRIAVMEWGHVVQTGSGRDLLEAPVSPFVAALTGVNYFTGVAARRGDLTEIRPGEGEGIFLSTDPASGHVGVAVPPWEVSLSPGRPYGSARNALAGPISRIAGVGNRVRVTVASRPPIVAEVTDESVRQLGLAPGEPVVASWKATCTRLVARSN
jgi:molybdate transport system ATP-binding protein